MQRLVVADQETATRAIARGLQRALDGGLKVLWLLSGGSNIPVELAVLAQLRAMPDNLVVSVADERFVLPGSPDSNWRQLLDGGLTAEKARLEPPITNTALERDAAAADFAARLASDIEWADVTIGQFGIGSDGHTAGILPHSPAVREASVLAVGYQAADFQRITTTPALFRRLDLAIAVALGESKRQIIERMASDHTPDEQPAQLLKAAKDLIVYTDQKVAWQ